MNLEAYLDERRRTVDRELERLLPHPEGPSGTVARGMRHAVLGGGKRLRPILTLAACDACGGEVGDALAPACALELIHTYSLVHDDLPAMDDDDLRRGRPTLHRAFGEAAAILAGDALLTLAFELLGSRPSGPSAAARRAAAVTAAARSAGIGGMVGGQMADLESEKAPVDAERLGWIHSHKTGALFAASAEIGAIHARADERRCRVMARFGAALGLAFQIADDILDRTATAQALGKTPGKDLRAGKATYPGLLGLPASRAEAERAALAAREALTSERLLTEPLAALTRFAVSRSG